MSKLSVDYSFSSSEIDKLLDLEKNLPSLSPRFQKLVAEIVMLRLFYLFQESVASIATKLVCGASYIDGSMAAVLAPARSATAAHSNMRLFGRSKPRSSLKWSKVSDIKENVKYVVAPTEHFVTVLDHHGTFVDEMRRVRNRIAHNNLQARQNYRFIVQRYYGAFLNSVTPGTLLLSTRRSPALLNQYLTKTKILLKAIAKA
ncbi:MAG TPA: hypothetical protein VI306_07425 [Pyrinomonadaceae bacterium]